MHRSLQNTRTTFARKYVGTHTRLAPIASYGQDWVKSFSIFFFSYVLYQSSMCTSLLNHCHDSFHPTTNLLCSHDHNQALGSNVARLSKLFKNNLHFFMSNLVQGSNVGQDAFQRRGSDEFSIVLATTSTGHYDGAKDFFLESTRRFLCIAACVCVCVCVRVCVSSTVGDSCQ